MYLIHLITALDVDGRWMVVHKTATGVHCPTSISARRILLVWPLLRPSFDSLDFDPRTEPLLLKRQRTQVFWSGFIHVQKLQCTERTLAWNQTSLALVPITCLNSFLSSCRCRMLAPQFLVHTSNGSTFHESVSSSWTKIPQMVCQMHLCTMEDLPKSNTNNNVFSEIPMFPSCDFGQT